MLIDILNIIVGAGATVLYLYIWRRLSSTALVNDEKKVPAAKMRSRIWQLLFLLGLTPYVLLVFFLMDTMRRILYSGP